MSVVQEGHISSDREVDQLVYELYGLTDKEIALVEEATKQKGKAEGGRGKAELPLAIFVGRINVN